MAADPVTALSIEEKAYGLEHLADMTPPGFAPIPVSPFNSFEMLGVDTLQSHRIYCVENNGISRLLYARKWGPPRERRVPRAVLTDVLNRTEHEVNGLIGLLRGAI